MTVDDYVEALRQELRDQPGRIRRGEAKDLREHLEELPPGALADLDEPVVYARDYRAQRGFRKPPVTGTWRLYSWPFRVLLVVIALVVAGIIVVPPWVRHYQPVTASVVGGGPDNVPSHTELDSNTVFSYRDGGIIRVAVQFVNSGRFDATITGYDDEGEDLSVLKFATVRVGQDGNPFPTRAAHFPLRVPAHNSLTIMLALRMSNCEYYFGSGHGHGDDIVSYDQLKFAMKTLGVSHTVIVPLTDADQIFVDMPGPKTPSCPRPRPPGGLPPPPTTTTTGD